MFRYYMKLGAKWVELVQYSQVCAIKSHRNFSQRTHSIHPIGTKLMFWSISKCFGAFGNVSLQTELGIKWVELVHLAQKFVPRSRIRIFLQRMHPIHPIASETHVLVHLVVFGCILDCFVTERCLMQKRAELEQLMQKFVPFTRIWIFYNEHTRSTPLDPKLMFWCVS